MIRTGYACVLVTLSLLCACEGDEDNDGGGAGTSSQAGMSGDGDGDGNSCENPTGTSYSRSNITGFCGDCLCRRCPSLLPSCGDACFDLIVCMHRRCDGNTAELEDCAADACSEYADGLAGAQQIMSCIYDRADLDRRSSERESCFIGCNFNFESTVP